MLVLATVQAANYCLRGSEYVRKFYDGVRRHMPRDIAWRGICFTDDAATVPNDIEAKELPSGLHTWWNKLAMFRPDTFEPGTRILYSDLDVIPCGDLGDIARYAGRFCIFRDPFEHDKMNSALMAWEAGTLDHIWTRFDEAGRPQWDKRGDQAFIEAVEPVANRWPSDQVVSWKADCWMQGGIPANARLIGFHGRPRPHECRAPYILDLWNRPLPAIAS